MAHFEALGLRLRPLPLRTPMRSERRIAPPQSGALFPERVAHCRRTYGNAPMEVTRSLYVASDGCHPHCVGHSLIVDRLFDLVRQTLGQPVLPEAPSGDRQ